MRLFKEKFDKSIPELLIENAEKEITKMHNNKLRRILLAVILIFLVVLDRIAWASIAHWREDQATNIWLGFTQPINQIPFGLISSYGVPNPNGMVLLGKLLSFLPNLWLVSTFLGCVQAAVIIWAAYEIEKSCNKNSKNFIWLLSLPLLTSILLRVTSVEFWNNWIILLINLTFLLWISAYYRNPSLYKISFLIGLILFTPAVFLAAGVNAIVMFALGGIVILYKPPDDWKHQRWMFVLVTLVVSGIIIFVSWIPYLKVVFHESFIGFDTVGSLSLKGKIYFAADAVVRSPLWLWNHWQHHTAKYFIPRSGVMLSGHANQIIHSITYIHNAQMIFALVTVFWSFIYHRKNEIKFIKQFEKVDRGTLFLVIISFAFVLFSYAISPILGGPIWARYERIEHIIAFYPFLLVFWILFPFIFTVAEKIKNWIKKISLVIVIIYSALNIIAGVLLVQAHLDYRGDVLTSADVPLYHIEQAVDFIAQDWISKSDEKTIPVDYQLGGGVWNWIPEYGKSYEPWYPAPFTVARVFDYELLRKYELQNSQEGIQMRSVGEGRYLVNYSFEPPFEIMDRSTSVFLFGRLRVTVVDP